MQVVSDNTKILINAHAKVTLTVYIDGEKLDVGIGSSSYTGACAGDDEFSFGNACAAGMIIGLGKTIHGLKGHRIVVKWAVDGTEYPLLNGQIDNYKVTAGRTEVEAWDDMYFAGSELFDIPAFLTEECDAVDAFSAVAAAMGVAAEKKSLTLLSGIVIPGGLANIGEDATNSAVAGYIAGLVGGNALISRDGQLAIRQYTQTGWQTEPYSGGAGADNEDFSVTGITLQRTETVAESNSDGTSTEQMETTEYSAGDGSLMVANPLACQDAADRAYAALRNLSIRPGSYSFPGGLLLEPGDIFTVHSMDGSYSVAVGSISMDFDGGVKSSVSCGGEGERGGIQGAINKTLQALILDFAKFKKLEAENASIVRAIIDDLHVNSLHAEVIHLLTDSDGFFAFYEWDELNAFIEETVNEMASNTSKSYFIVIEVDSYSGSALLNIARGFGADRFASALATLTTAYGTIYRYADSESGGAEGAHAWYWYGDRYGGWSGNIDGITSTLWGGTGRDLLPAGKYLVGADVDYQNRNPVALKSPEEVLKDIGAASLARVMRNDRVANLLDNSDFRNPVNQRGSTEYTSGADYSIDRWMALMCMVVVCDGYISVRNPLTGVGKFIQPILPKALRSGSVYTIAVKRSDSTNLIVGSGSYVSGTTTSFLDVAGSSIGFGIYQLNGNDAVYIDIPVASTVNIEWVALYEGEYTANNLPSYVPKGYAAELAECQRYYKRFSSTASLHFLLAGVRSGSSSYYTTLHLGVPMRTTPTLDWGGLNCYALTTGSNIAVDSMSIGAISNEKDVLYLSGSLASAPDKDLVIIRIQNGGYVALSADL